MKKAYDRHGASQLVPLLESITREIAERLEALQGLEARVETLSKRVHADEICNLQAEIATHRLGIRLAAKEFEALGCVFDESAPARILIPGADGKLERGFHWDLGGDGIHRRSADPQAA